MRIFLSGVYSFSRNRTLKKYLFFFSIPKYSYDHCVTSRSESSNNYFGRLCFTSQNLLAFTILHSFSGQRLDLFYHSFTGVFTYNGLSTLLAAVIFVFSRRKLKSSSSKIIAALSWRIL